MDTAKGQAGGRAARGDGAPQTGTPGAAPGTPPMIKDFESAIAELEKIVKQLEDGDLALDKSLALFERGVELSRFCHAQLGEAQRRIEVLTERGELKDAAALADKE